MAKKKRKSTAQVNLGGESTRPKPKQQTQVYSPPEMSFGEILKARWHLILTFAVIVLGSTYIFAFFGMADPVEKFGFEVVGEYKHDPDAFTQGLLYHDGHLYESTGSYGKSSVRKVDIKTGNVLVNQRLPDDYFGEGLVKVGDKLVQLTWKNNRVFEYDMDLKPLGPSRVIDCEGWGLTYDGTNLIATTGWNELHYFDPATLERKNKLTITQGATRIDKINELEFVDGKIYANKLDEDWIYIIDPKTAQVVGKVDLTKLYTVKDGRPYDGNVGVLNGIAYNPEKKTFYVTGKNWPKLFEIKIVKGGEKTR